MAQVFSFPFHKLKGVDVPCDCSKEHGGWNCPCCAGGLALCVVCGGAEGSLPSDCPGQPMQPWVADAVYDGWLDYDRKLGWVRRSSTLAAACRRG